MQVRHVSSSVLFILIFNTFKTIIGFGKKLNNRKNWKQNYSLQLYKHNHIETGSVAIEHRLLVISSFLSSPLYFCSTHENTNVVKDLLLTTNSWQGGEFKYSEMGFGEDLWCPQAHAAVMRLLDSELHLMEVMKKWMGQRAKSEREFSVQLHYMAAMVEKLDRSQHGAGLDYISQLNKVRTYTTMPRVCDFNLPQIINNTRLKMIKQNINVSVWRIYLGAKWNRFASIQKIVLPSLEVITLKLLSFSQVYYT